MNILILGAGAIGGYYGAQLIAAGADVAFLVRPERARILARDNLRIHSPRGSIILPIRTVLAGELDKAYDLVIIACKTYDLEAAMEDVAPAIGTDTGILPFLNGISAYERLDARFGKDRILGGIAYVATQLDSEGGIHHIGAGDSVIVGARSPTMQERARQVHALLGKSSGSRMLSSNIEQQLWDKWVMLASGAAMNCLVRGSVADIMATSDGKRLMKRAMQECCDVARLSGFPLSADALMRIEKILLDPASPWIASMMRDIAQGKRRLEADAIVGDMAARAVRYGADAPILSAAYCALQVYTARARQKG